MRFALSMLFSVVLVLLSKFFAPFVARLFHAAVGCRSAHPMQRRHAQAPFLHPIAGEFAALSFGKNLFDRVTIHDSWAASANCELSSSTTTTADIFFDADFIHHINHAAERANRLGIREA